MKKFIPAPHKVEIEPIKQENLLMAQDEVLIEMGKVIGVGQGVKFLKMGDIVYFRAYGRDKTPEIDGVIHHVVAEHEDFIIGKESNAVAKK